MDGQFRASVAAEVLLDLFLLRNVIWHGFSIETMGLADYYSIWFSGGWSPENSKMAALS